MIDPNELNTIKNAILKNTATQDHDLAIAIMNLGLHVLGNLDRIANAIDKPITQHERPWGLAEFETAVVDVINKHRKPGGLLA